jgi:hypothetical protein
VAEQQTQWIWVPPDDPSQGPPSIWVQIPSAAPRPCDFSVPEIVKAVGLLATTARTQAGIGEIAMVKSPWHSIKQSVHHNNTDCNTGNNIEKENLRDGTGGKPLCKECADLQRK